MERVGPYCSQCGQRVRPRLTVPGLVAEAAQHVLSLDSGLLRTAVDLVRRPAGLIRDVFAGRTVRYAGPVRYFLVAVTVTQLVSLALDGAVEGFTEGFNNARESGAAAVSEDQVRQAFQSYWVVVLAGAVPVISLWSRLLLRRSGLTFAEHLTTWLYLIGQTVLGLGLAFGLSAGVGALAGTGGDVAGAAVLAGTLVLPLWASVGVFRRGRLWSPLAAALSLLLGYAVYGLAVALVAVAASS